jgi:hypothetical protein
MQECPVIQPMSAADQYVSSGWMSWTCFEVPLMSAREPPVAC